MFYFTCNESKIYESFTFWNKLQEKNELFHDILIYWDAPVNLQFWEHISTPPPPPPLPQNWTLTRNLIVYITQFRLYNSKF